jgi:hypothetical protein
MAPPRVSLCIFMAADGSWGMSDSIVVRSDIIIDMTTNNFQQPNSHDPMLKDIADAAKLVTISVGYRLAPEAPFPAGPQDCYDVAEWLVDHAMEEFGATLKFIGGEVGIFLHLCRSLLLSLFSLTYLKLTRLVRRSTPGRSDRIPPPRPRQAKLRELSVKRLAPPVWHV